MTPKRWKRFALPDRILMVSNEVHRATSALRKGSVDTARRAYLRALDLFDLTVATLVRPRPAQLKEFLRWRELLAQETTRESPGLDANLALLKALLLLTRRSALQVPHVCRVEG
jgi:hypothetical protein